MKCEWRSAARRSLRAASRCCRMRSASRRAKYSSSLRWRLLRCGMDPFSKASLIYTERSVSKDQCVSRWDSGFPVPLPQLPSAPPDRQRPHVAGGGAERKDGPLPAGACREDGLGHGQAVPAGLGPSLPSGPQIEEGLGALPVRHRLQSVGLGRREPVPGDIEAIRFVAHVFDVDPDIRAVRNGDEGKARRMRKAERELAIEVTVQGRLAGGTEAELNLAGANSQVLPEQASQGPMRGDEAAPVALEPHVGDAVELVIGKEVAEPGDGIRWQVQLRVPDAHFGVVHAPEEVNIRAPQEAGRVGWASKNRWACAQHLTPGGSGPVPDWLVPHDRPHGEPAEQGEEQGG